MNGIVLLASAMPMLFGSALAATVIVERRRASLRHRIRQTIGRYNESGAVGIPLQLDTGNRATTLVKVGWLPTSFASWLKSEFGATGDRLSVAHLVVAGLLSGTAVFFLFETMLSLNRLLVFAVAVLVAVTAPFILLRHMQRRFQTRFLHGLPDALDFIVRGLRAGLPIVNALEAIATEVGEPVGSEFRRVHDGVAIGIDFHEELAHAADRIRLVEFRFFVVALALQRQTGGNLAETVENLSTLIRRRKEMALKARALTSEARASAWLIGCLPFVAGTALYFINPDYMRVLFTDPRGQVLLEVAMGSLATGAFILRVMITRGTR